MSKKKYYVYLYFNKAGTVIYVGLTERPLANRVREHKTEALQKETDHVEFAEVANKTDMRMYELYYINKYQPKYNIAEMYHAESSIAVQKLTFIPYLEQGCEEKVNPSGEKRRYTFLCRHGKIEISVLDPYTRHPGPVRIEVTGNPELDRNELDQLIEQLKEVRSDLE